MIEETKSLTWYFSYGSNMNRGIFENRRGMRPIQERTALLENYCLCFNLPIGRGERGVANLEPHLGGRTWGVLYLITTEQSEHLDRARRPFRWGDTAGFQSASSSTAMSRSQPSRISQCG